MFVFKPTTTKDKVLLAVSSACMAAFGAFVMIFSLLYLEPELWLYATILVCSSFVLFLIFFFLWNVVRKQYSFKYLFLGKDYEKQLAEVLPHFESGDEKMKNQLVKECKHTYRVFGKVLQYGSYESKSLYRNEKQLAVLVAMLEKLISSCDDGTGWEGFISECDKDDAFCYERLNFEGVMVKSPLDGWEIRSFVGSGVFSYAWQYLVGLVGDLCDFTLKDTFISEEYTKSVREAKERFKSQYSPMLFTFRDELESVLKRLTKSKAL